MWDEEGAANREMGADFQVHTYLNATQLGLINGNFLFW